MINKEKLKASKFLCDGFAGLIDINGSIYYEKLQRSMEKDIISRICDMNDEIYNEVLSNIRSALNQYEQTNSQKRIKKSPAR